MHTPSDSILKIRYKWFCIYSIVSLEKWPPPLSTHFKSLLPLSLSLTNVLVHVKYWLTSLDGVKLGLLPRRKWNKANLQQL